MGSFLKMAGEAFSIFYRQRNTTLFYAGVKKLALSGELLFCRSDIRYICERQEWIRKAIYNFFLALAEKKEEGMIH